MDWPLSDGQRYSDAGMLTASSTGTLLTNGGVAHAKGVYTELIASTLFDALGFFLYVVNTAAATGQRYLIDIAVGADTVEKVIMPNFLVDCGGVALQINAGVWCPIPVPASSRVAARQQSNGTSGAVRVGIVLLTGGFFSVLRGGKAIDLGTALASSNGAIIDPGAVAHTKGVYTELTASTPHDLRAVVLAIGANSNINMASATWLLDLSIGAAAAEQVKIPNMLISSAANRIPLPSQVGPLPFTVPGGSRIAVRGQCTSTDSTDRKLAIAAYGIQ